MKKLIYYVISALSVVIISFLILNTNGKKDSNLKTVRVSEVAHSIFYAPQYAAISEGYFKDLGLDIKLSLTPGADKVTAAVLSGDSDIGFSGSEACIYVFNSGEKDYLKTFAQLTQKDGSFIVSKEDIKNFNLYDLIGKTIIGGRIGGMPEMTLEWILKEHNIDPKIDVNIDTSVQFAAMAGAFISSDSEFVSLFEPSALEVEKQGYGYVVASLGELGGNVPYTSYSARISYIEKNKDIIENFTKAIQKGLDFVHNSDSETIAKSILEFFPDTSLSDLTKVIERYKNIDAWPKTTNFSSDAFYHLQDIMINANQLDTSVKYSDIIEQIN